MWQKPRKTALLIARNGFEFLGYGIGAEGAVVGEVCFNTAMTGYQEILTDPSYAEQIITFTFPHIGNVGANEDDNEAPEVIARAASGLIIREPITTSANYRARTELNDWLSAHGLIGISGVDTRALTLYIREHGMFDAVLAHNADGNFDRAALRKKLDGFSGLTGCDLASTISTNADYAWQEGRWTNASGFCTPETPYHVVALDFGIKKNILRCLASAGCRVSVLPASASLDDILAHKPDGVFLSNGPGDPAATAPIVLPTLHGLIDKSLPIFGICLGHQLLAEALGAKTEKMRQGHHGANHPVKDLASGKVEIVSMNHGFAVARDSLPTHLEETHISLFDNTNCGIAVKDKPIFSVQYHPEASPGPQDSHYLFEQFVKNMKAA